VQGREVGRIGSGSPVFFQSKEKKVNLKNPLINDTLAEIFPGFWNSNWKSNSPGRILPKLDKVINV